MLPFLVITCSHVVAKMITNVVTNQVEVLKNWHPNSPGYVYTNLKNHLKIITQNCPVLQSLSEFPEKMPS